MTRHNSNFNQPDPNRSSLNQSSPNQWETYKRLELIPDAAPRSSTAFAFGVGWFWKGLLHLLVNELIVEQQVEYLDRCWALNEPDSDNHLPANTLQRLWVLMN
jgi:hypothetical protein